MAAKALAANVLDSDAVLQWYESVTPFAFVLAGDKIWTEATTLRANPAANLATAQANAAGPLSGIITDLSAPASAVRLSPIPGVNNTWVATSSYNDLSTRLENWVQPQFVPQSNGLPSVGYAVRLYEGDPNGGGTEILTTDGTTGTGSSKSVAWIFNYSLGMLLISDDFSSVTDPYILGFRYIGTTVDDITGSGGSSLNFDIFRENIQPSGPYDGSGRDYTIPDAAVHDPPRAQVKVYHGGRRLIHGPIVDGGEYEMIESGGAGTGYDTIRLTAFAPKTNNKPLICDYLVDPTTGGGGQPGHTITRVNGNASAITKGQAVYVSSGTDVDLAQADAASTSIVLGLVKDLSVASAGEVQIQLDGVIEQSDWTTVTGSASLSINSKYYLSESTAGSLTTTAPSSVGQYVVEVGVALSATELLIRPRARKLL